MPFDGRLPSKNLRIVSDMMEMLAKPEHWCQGAREKTRLGYPSRCLIGALYDAVPDASVRTPRDWVNCLVYQQMMAEVRRRSRVAYIGNSVPDFNDHKRTTHADIVDFLRCVRERIIALEEHLDVPN